MTERERGIREARRAARDLLKRWGVRSAAHIVVEAFAAAMGVGIVEGTLQGSRARLSGGGTPRIRVSDKTPSAAAKRFSIAHELAHHILKHPLGCVDAGCTRVAEKAKGDPTERDYEIEANAFATELLMPRNLVAPRCAKQTPSLDVPRAIASEFATSLSASAIRFVELTSERCAAVYSEDGAVVWAPPSAKFKTRIPRGKQIDRGALAFGCIGKRTTEDRAGRVAAHVWLDTDAKVEIVEHSATVPEVGGVITLLWVPESEADALGMRGVERRARENGPRRSASLLKRG